MKWLIKQKRKLWKIGHFWFVTQISRLFFFKHTRKKVVRNTEKKKVQNTPRLQKHFIGKVLQKNDLFVSF